MLGEYFGEFGREKEVDQKVRKREKDIEKERKDRAREIGVRVKWRKNSRK